MNKKLLENQEKLTKAAYNKAMYAANRIESLFSVSGKLLSVIADVFKELSEVTPLMLQKLLYTVQGIYLALYDKPVFREDCRAWIHGPVYPEVYSLFREFKYNPIEDARFALLEGAESSLKDDEKKVINLVVNTFGMYSAKALERITHNEAPWKDARKGYGDGIRSNEIISKESMKEYFVQVHKKYNIETESGLMDYIHEMLGAKV